MKKIIVMVLSILCLCSLSSCKKNEEIATRSEIEAFLNNKHLNFSDCEYNCYYTIKLNTKDSDYGNTKVRAKGYVIVDNIVDVNLKSVQFTMDGKYVSKDKSANNKKITSKEKIVAFDFGSSEKEEVYLYKKSKTSGKGELTKEDVKTKKIGESIIVDKEFLKLLKSALYLDEFLKNIIKQVYDNSLFYINGDNCKIILASKDTIEKTEIEMEFKGEKLQKIQFKRVSYMNNLELNIDLTKKTSIKKPKDSSDYIPIKNQKSSSNYI